MKFLLKLQTLTALFFSSIIYAQPNIGGYNIYFGTLHNHSAISDGTGTPDEAYNYAKNIGHLDFFCLTDHSDGAGEITPAEWNAMQTAADIYYQPGVFTTLRGFEWTNSTYGHMTIINSANYCTTVSPTNTFSGLFNWLNGQECIATFNHPGLYNTEGKEFDHFSSPINPKIVGIELCSWLNGYNVFYYNDGYYPNDTNKGYFDEALIRGWKISSLGGEDNHTGNMGNYVNFRTAILAKANTRDELYKSLKAKRFYSTSDKNLALSFKLCGQEMGSEIVSGTYDLNIKASDVNGEIFTQVQLLKNGVVINTWVPNAAAPDIQSTVTVLNKDYYYVRIKQSDGDEAVSAPIWINGVNKPPVINISSPAPNEVFHAPAIITINVNASDADGSITKVEFYNGATLITTDYASPYTYTRANVQAGNFSLRAIASDNSGASTTSSTVNISVLPNQPPIVNITSPQAGETFFDPATITLAASASDTDGSISKVDFYYEGTLLLSDNTSPYSYTRADVPQGYYTITAQAIDNNGAITVSTPVSFSVIPGNPPTVSIYSPVSGSSFTAPALIEVKASASDSDGMITKVDFYNGSNLISTDDTKPYSLIRSDVNPGTYTVKAIATDNSGLTTSSNEVMIYVFSPAALSLKSGALNDPADSPAKIETSSSLKCYPVPFNDELHIDFIPSTGEYIRKIEILNSIGMCVRYMDENENHPVMDLHNLKAGIYIVRVRSNSGTYNQVVVKN